MKSLSFLVFITSIVASSAAIAQDYKISDTIGFDFSPTETGGAIYQLYSSEEHLFRDTKTILITQDLQWNASASAFERECGDAPAANSVKTITVNGGAATVTQCDGTELMGMASWNLL